MNLLCPGWTNTSLLDFEAVARHAGTTVEEAIESASSESAQHRVLEPEELTGMATLLASDEGAGITGQVISRRRRLPPLGERRHFFLFFFDVFFSIFSALR